MCASGRILVKFVEGSISSDPCSHTPSPYRLWQHEALTRLHAATISRWLVCFLMVVAAKLSQDGECQEKEYLHLVIAAASERHPKFNSDELLLIGT